MASALFNPGREGFLKAEIDWDTGVMKAALVRGYTFVATHKFVSDVTNAGGSLVGSSGSTPVTIASPGFTDGVADGADVVFTAVTAGAACPALIIFQASAVTGGADVAATAQRLVAYIDTATGLPVTPNGQNITITWDNGSNRIFKL